MGLRKQKKCNLHRRVDLQNTELTTKKCPNCIKILFTQSSFSKLCGELLYNSKFTNSLQAILIKSISFIWALFKKKGHKKIEENRFHSLAIPVSLVQRSFYEGNKSPLLVKTVYIFTCCHLEKFITNKIGKK